MEEDGEDRHPVVRTVLFVAGLGATIGVVLANFWALLYVGNSRCGDEGNPSPIDGSALDAYCSFLELDSPFINVLLVGIYYGPMLVTVVGMVTAVAYARSRWLVLTLGASVLWLATLVLLGAFLPGRTTS